MVRVMAKVRVMVKVKVTVKIVTYIGRYRGIPWYPLCARLRITHNLRQRLVD